MKEESFGDSFFNNLRKTHNCEGEFGPATVHTSYIPTPFIVPPEIKVGENWYIKRPEKTSLDKVEVIEVTQKTIQVLDIGRVLHEDSLLRFKKSDIEFVEKVEEKL